MKSRTHHAAGTNWTLDGETITVQVPDEPGDYAFFCSIHPSMTGTLTAE